MPVGSNQEIAGECGKLQQRTLEGLACNGIDCFFGLDMRRECQGFDCLAVAFAGI